MAHDDAQHMVCMEVWGGNRPADNAVVMAGLDAWIYCKPYGQSDSGGDVYYVSSCATGRITRLLLADVSGHGSLVAETATALRRLMQRYVNFIDQSAFVRSMNQRFAELSDAGSFATAIVSTFFGPTNDLSLCIAGHPPPLLYRAAERRWILLNQDGQEANIPLGIDDVADWTQFDIQLSNGDLVLCYTDSLIESRGADGEMLGTEGLLQTIIELDLPDVQQVIPTLLGALASKAGGNLSEDDVTVLLFRPNGMAPPAPLKEKLFAPFRVLRGIVGSFRPGGGPTPWPEFNIANIGGAIFSPLNRMISRRAGKKSIT